MNCGVNSQIVIEAGGDVYSEKTGYSFWDSTCISHPGLENLWLGFNYTADAGSSFDFKDNTVRDAWCGIYGDLSLVANGLFSAERNIFESNAKALWLEGDPLASPSVDSNKIIKNTFLDPWSYNTDIGIMLPEFNGFTIDLTEHVSVYDLKKTLLLRNIFRKTAPQITLVYLDPLNQPLMPISGPNNNQGSLFVSRKAIGIKSSENSVNTDVKRNTFERWENSVWIDEGVGQTNLIANKFTESDPLSPDPVVYCFGSLNSSNNRYDEGSRGLYLINSNASVIESDTFNSVSQNIYIQGGVDNVIQNNIFSNMTSSLNYEGYGVHLYGTMGSIVSQNQFSGGTAYGIISDNTGMSVSYLYDNSFGSYIGYGVQTDMDNLGYKIKCNTFAADGVPHLFGIFHIDGQLANQGLDCSSNNLQAGNEWLDQSSATEFWQDIILTDSADQFSYIAHPYEINSPFDETTNPTKTNLDTVIICNGTPIMFKDSNSCTGIYDGWLKPPKGDGLSNELSELLSKLIIERNALVSALLSLESSLYDPLIQTELVVSLNSIRSEIDLMTKGIVNIYKSVNDYAAIYQILDNYPTVEAKMTLYQAALDNNDLIKAQSALSALDALENPSYMFSSSDIQVRHSLNKKHFVQLEGLKQVLKSENRGKDELTADEINNLVTISNLNLPISAEAKSLLAYNDIAIYPRDIKKVSELELNNLLYGNSNTVDYNLTVSPNPANQFVDVCFTLPTTSTNVYIKIIDEYNQVGLLLRNRKMNEGEFCSNFDLSVYLSGMYRVLLEIDGEIVDGEHLILNN